MNDVQEINVDELMAQVRENLSNRQRSRADLTPLPSANGPVTADLAALERSHDIYHLHLTSHRKILGPFILLAKKVVKQLLTPSLERQSEYNGANNRVALHLWQQTVTLQKISSELAEQLRAGRQELAEQVAGRQELAEQVAGRHQQLARQMHDIRAELTEQVEGRHQQLARQMHDIRAELTEQVEGRHQQLARQMQETRDELIEHIGGVHEEQGAALQALRGELAERMGAVHQEQGAALQALRGELAERMGAVHQEQGAALQALRAEVVEQVAGVQREQAVALREMRERSSRAERRVRRLLDSRADGQKTSGQVVEDSLAIPKEISYRHPEPSFDYFGFEERFRGNEADIKGRQRAYVEFFQGSDLVLDVGCGRGEFLELLREAGIKGKGVDLDLDMVLLCQEKELDVIREDAFAYLESLPDASLGGLFAAQVVEHLEPSRIIELVNLCHRKLRSGGVLILETPNPVCLMVFATTFYMDFSHIRPVHPEAMRFLFESVGFEEVQARFSAPVEPSMRIPPLSDGVAGAHTVAEFNRGIERLNELLYGCQDYAVIGRKASR
jgi:SAM-dependent methyltransferase